MKRSMAILIVDDSAVALAHLRMMLVQAGFSDVRAVGSPAAALATLELDEGPSFDLVMLDVVMPGMDGVEICRRIKANERLRDTPVIMVTAQTELQQLAAAFAAGATDYLTKPAAEVELLARVRSALRLKAETDARKAREKELLRLTRQLEAANAELARISASDALTGIANRRSFEEALAQQWEWRRWVSESELVSPRPPAAVRRRAPIGPAFAALRVSAWWQRGPGGRRRAARRWRRGCTPAAGRAR